MTGNLAVFSGHKPDDAVTVFSQCFREFSLHRLTKRRRNDLVVSFPVALAFFADSNQHPT